MYMLKYCVSKRATKQSRVLISIKVTCQVLYLGHSTSKATLLTVLNIFAEKYFNINVHWFNVA